jgi:hypothetical protein
VWTVIGLVVLAALSIWIEVSWRLIQRRGHQVEAGTKRMPTSCGCGCGMSAEELDRYFVERALRNTPKDAA